MKDFIFVELNSPKSARSYSNTKTAIKAKGLYALASPTKLLTLAMGLFTTAMGDCYPSSWWAYWSVYQCLSWRYVCGRTETSSN